MKFAFDGAAYIQRIWTRTNSRIESVARKLTREEFLRIDVLAVWFYAICLSCFVMAVAADLNGSSSGMYFENHGMGVREHPYLGAPRNIRSDEWAYSTADVLSQVLRTDRFSVETSNLGSHSVALAGNIPVKHFSEVFRPQYWAFFVLPVDYAFAFYWQAKALLLVAGMFTWLLLLTRSSAWSIIGVLWFLFSPFTQWSYSWPTGLPEMIGLGCLATVCFCYLTIGNRLAPLLVAGMGVFVCSIDFALCSYLPHLIPLVLINGFVCLGWIFANRKRIATGDSLRMRLAVGFLLAVGFAWMGAAIYADLRVAIHAVADTLYPGHRIVSGGSWPPWVLASHFLPWGTNEDHFPPVLLNICEGSGFLWLAPFALFCFSPSKLGKEQRIALAMLCAIGLILTVWLVFPVPAKVGGLLLLNRVTGGRILPAMGLANVAIVCLCMSGASSNEWFRGRLERLRGGSILVLTTLLCFWVLQATNAKLDHFFSTRRVFFGSFVAALFITLMVSRRRKLLAVLLVGAHVFSFGAVNPMKRGLRVFLDSDLRRFMSADASYRRDRWVIFTDNTTRPGFFAAAGCQILNGSHYLPDIDHFGILRARGFDLNLFNRLGYLNTMPISKPPGEALKLISQPVVEWDVLPDDPTLREIGVRYAAFGTKPPVALVKKLRPLTDHAIDKFWLYELPQ